MIGLSFSTPSSSHGCIIFLYDRISVTLSKPEINIGENCVLSLIKSFQLLVQYVYYCRYLLTFVMENDSLSKDIAERYISWCQQNDTCVCQNLQGLSVHLGSS